MLIRYFFTGLNRFFRASAAQRAVTGTIILTLGIGIGSNTVLFSIANAVLIRPLPYDAPHRIVQVKSAALDGRGTLGSLPDLQDWRKEANSFDRLAGCWPLRMRLAGARSAQSVIVALASPELFDVFRTRTIRGRTFSAEESYRADVKQAILSYSLWTNRFGADETILGRDIALEGTPYRVIGVMPDGIRYPSQTDIWVPLASYQADRRLEERSGRYLFIYGRLKEGVSLAGAQSELDAISVRLAERFPNTNRTIRAKITTLADAETRAMRPYILLLSGAVGFLLLICCGNVANLLLTATLSRRREIGIRLALGAPRALLISQMFMESAFLAISGGILGTILAYWIIGSLHSFIPVTLPPWMRVEVDGSVLLFTFSFSLLTSAVFGFAPAAKLARLEPCAGLNESSPWITSRSLGIREIITTLQVAFAVISLVGAGLLGRSFLNLQAVNPGFFLENMAVVHILPPGISDRLGLASARAAYLPRTIAALKSLPGVVAVGGSNTLPYTRDADLRSPANIIVKGGAVNKQEQRIHDLLFSDVSDDYFRTMNIPLVRGRTYTDADTAQSAPVVIVSNRTAQMLWPNQDPIGQQLQLDKWFTVVGVVGDVKYRPTESVATAEMYFSFKQSPPGHFFCFVRTAGDASAVLPAMQKVVSEIDRDAVVISARTMRQVKEEFLWQERLWGLLFVIFAAIASGLAALGIYGTVSFSVTQRTKEIGIRIALGATPNGLVASIVLSAVRLTAVGILVGYAGTFPLSRLATALLFGVTPGDIKTLLTVAMVMLLMTSFAAYLAAYRRARIDPMITLRMG